MILPAIPCSSVRLENLSFGRSCGEDYRLQLLRLSPPTIFFPEIIPFSVILNALFSWMTKSFPCHALVSSFTRSTMISIFYFVSFRFLPQTISLSRREPAVTPSPLPNLVREVSIFCFITLSSLSLLLFAVLMTMV